LICRLVIRMSEPNAPCTDQLRGDTLDIITQIDNSLDETLIRRQAGGDIPGCQGDSLGKHIQIVGLLLESHLAIVSPFGSKNCFGELFQWSVNINKVIDNASNERPIN